MPDSERKRTENKGMSQFAKAEIFWLSIVLVCSVLLGVWLAP